MILAACAAPLPLPIQAENLQPVMLSDEERHVIEVGIKDRLKDPESAHFEGLVAGKGSDGVTSVYGWVNARNSFGGYTGKQPFIGILAPARGGSLLFVPLDSNESTSDQRATLQTCDQYGLTLG